MTDHEHIWSAVTVGPDDTLVILLPDATTQQRVDQLTADLRARRPDLDGRVVFVAGATGLAVLKASEG